MPNDSSIVITVLGSGTSVGVPTIGCNCPVCKSDDPRDKRLRPSVLVSYVGTARNRNVLIDTTPDFRQQALVTGFKPLDAILFTHHHADHIMGLDDIRPYNYGRPERIPLYATEPTLKSLQRVFPYAFTGESGHPGGVPRVEARLLNGGAVDLFGLAFQPVPLWHGPMKIVGFRFGAAAYLTDHSDIPDESLPWLENLDVLFLDALRRAPHPMHTSLDEALAWVEKLKPRRAFFTHICHDLPHAATNKTLPSNVELAYDGLRIKVAGAAHD